MSKLVVLIRSESDSLTISPEITRTAPPILESMDCLPSAEADRAGIGQAEFVAKTLQVGNGLLVEPWFE